MTRNDVLSGFFFSFLVFCWILFLGHIYREYVCGGPESFLVLVCFVWCLAMAGLVLHYTHFERRLVLDIVCGNTDLEHLLKKGPGFLL